MAVPKYVWPVVAVAVFGGAIFLSGRPVKSPEGNDLITNANEYQAANTKVREYTLPAFNAETSGQAITPAMKEDLGKAIPLLHEMNRYAPIKVSAYFALGKTEMMLGHLPEGGRALEQSILNETADTEEKGSQGVTATVLEAKCLLAELMLDLSVQKLQESAGKSAPEVEASKKEARTLQERAANWAADAVKREPNSPRYWAALASSYIALGRPEQAKLALGKAAALDPNHFKVKPLLALVESAAKP